MSPEALYLVLVLVPVLVQKLLVALLERLAPLLSYHNRLMLKLILSQRVQTYFSS